MSNLDPKMLHRSGTSRLSRNRSLNASTTLNASQPITEASLSEWEEHLAEELFLAYDYDGTGMIEVMDVRELLMEQQWIMDSSALDNFVNSFVGKDAKTVNYEQFMHLYRAMAARQPTSIRKQKGARRIDVADLRNLERDTRRLFDEMDNDGSGYLNMDEMRNVMRESGLPDTDGDEYETVVLETMQFADKNQDGQISFEEFVLYRNAVLDNFFLNGVVIPPQTANTRDDDDQWNEYKFII